MERPTLNPFSRNPFRGYHELQDWLHEGETIIEIHGGRFRLSMLQPDGQVRFCETVYAPASIQDFNMMVNIVAQCFYDLHKQDFKITQ